MKKTRWLVHGGPGGSGSSVVRDVGRKTRGEDEDVAVHWCSSGDGVSDEGATGDGFPAWPVAVGHGGRMWSGRPWKMTAAEWNGDGRRERVRVRVLVV